MEGVEDKRWSKRELSQEGMIFTEENSRPAKKENIDNKKEIDKLPAAHK